MYKLFDWNHNLIGEFASLRLARQALTGLKGSGYLEYTDGAIEVYRAAKAFLRQLANRGGDKKFPKARPFA